MTKILVLSDDGVTSGYGRISMELNTHLVKRGYQVLAASLMYDGLLPPSYDGEPLPYHVAALGPYMPTGQWLERFLAVLNAYQPDIVQVTQDAPYAEAVRNAPVDWSRYAFMVITPVDGAPVYQQWVNMLKSADGTLSISQFGVDTHRAAGVPSELCRPGVNLDTFYPLPEDQRAAIRARLGLAPDAFLLMTCAQNQGRKAWDAMLRGFFRFAADKPSARYLINADRTSPAGWDIPQMCQMFGWDVNKLIFRDQCDQWGVHELRERYNAADAHVVLAHREGYGLPLTEAMACGVVSIALDYCSGTEVCGEGRGVLVRPLPFTQVSTWGCALDKFPDEDHFVQQLQWLYDNPDERRAMAKRGMDWARGETWSKAVDNTVKVIERIMAKRRAQALPVLAPVPIQQPVSVDGMKAEPVELLEAGA